MTTLLQPFAVCLALLWCASVGFGVLGRRRPAAVAGALAAVTCAVPFAPRLVAYLAGPEAFVARYGAWVESEIRVSAVLVTLALAALVTCPWAARRAWGWVLPASLTALPVALVVWFAFWFSIRF